jgi:hypothetical protein
MVKLLSRNKFLDRACTVQRPVYARPPFIVSDTIYSVEVSPKGSATLEFELSAAGDVK